MGAHIKVLSLLTFASLFTGCALLPGSKGPTPLDATATQGAPTEQVALANTATPTVTSTPLPTATPTLNPNSCFVLTVTVTPFATGAVGAAPGPDCPTDLNTYRAGTTVTLTAYPNVGSSFAGWGGDASGMGTTTVFMSGNKIVTATFTAPYTGPCYSLTASVNPAGGGAVNATPAPDCPTDPTKYRPGTVVALSALPGAGWFFSQWGGDAAGTTTAATVTMNANRAVTAMFNAVYTGACYAMSTSVLPAGGGTVRASPTPDCPTDPAKYRAGTIVTLTAYPAADWTFQGWGGHASGASVSTTMTMDSNKAITSAFVTAPQTVIPSTVTPAMGTATKTPGT